ncbi:hypothetical protein [Nocardioides sp. 616]|uniref:hypothetical protein n=1 Tax=Nocardioides sp. 616 TaxID=2268090 RepID=UPI000CE2F8C9|nr:hypothetical protein [Nocardioides sp. 616]
MAAAELDVCAEYGLALAIEDFVPVILAAAALVILARAVRRAVPSAYSVALVGAVTVALGGLGKATWKLLVASGCWEYPILERLLFPCLSFGFAALSWALLSAVLARTVVAWPFATFPVAAAVGAVWMGDTWPLLVAAAVGASFLGVTAAVYSFKAGKRSVGALFVIYVLGTNVLPPLAAQPEQSAGLQWIEQLTNSAVQLCFLLGALWLDEHLGQRSATAETDEHRGVPA